MLKCAAAAEKASCIQGCTGKMKAAGLESQYFLIFSNYKTDWSSVPCSGHLCRKTLTHWSESSRCHQDQRAGAQGVGSLLSFLLRETFLVS